MPLFVIFTLLVTSNAAALKSAVAESSTVMLEALIIVVV